MVKPRLAGFMMSMISAITSTTSASNGRRSAARPPGAKRRCPARRRGAAKCCAAAGRKRRQRPRRRSSAMPAIMSAPIGMPASRKPMSWPIRNIGRCSRTPAVTAITPRMKAHRPRRSEKVLVLIMGGRLAGAGPIGKDFSSSPNWPAARGRSADRSRPARPRSFGAIICTKKEGARWGAPSSLLAM